jgi:hypothetical protein
MIMFEKASRLKLRFPTPQGNATAEDLWDLPLTRLNSLAKNLNKQLKSAEEEDFLEEASSVDTVTKLSFDIVLHIIKTKQGENKARNEAAAKAQKKQELLELLDAKEKDAMKDLSADEIRQKIAELG